jgi:tellurite resistance protein TerA
MTTVNLTKGQAPVNMRKTPLITARVSWSSKTDYDVYALILRTNGTVETVATFGAQGVPAMMVTSDGRVRHLGDVGREAKGDAEEVLEIRLDDTIQAVVPVAYSAQSNGSGSFRKYKVSLEISNGEGDTVLIDARNANRDNSVYTCAIGVISNTPEGVLIDPLESYSRKGSENRPALIRDATGTPVVLMDHGPVNNYK